MSVPPSTAFTASMMNVIESQLGKRRYNVKIWKMFSECFNYMPVAALIDHKILCLHGGLSPDLNNLEQIAKITRP